MAFLDFDGLGKFKTKLDSRFVTSVSMSGNTIKYTKGDGTQTDVGTIASSPDSPAYTAGTGITISGTTISNAGVRAVSSGTTQGTISVNTNGTSANVAVNGLKSAAYTESSAYATSGHDHNGVYAPFSHNHDGVYAPLIHDHDGVYAPYNHDHDTTYLKLTGGKMTGTLTVPAVNGTASSASRLLDKHKLITNLASQTAASFDGSADADIGIKGTLPVANGGTGATDEGKTLLSNIGIFSGTGEPPSGKAEGCIYIKY